MNNIKALLIYCSGAIALLALLSLVSCNGEDHIAAQSDASASFLVKIAGTTKRVYRITIEGSEYFVIPVRDGFSFCPVTKKVITPEKP